MGYVFDGATQRISLTTGTTQLDLVDLYSRWKEWVLTADNSKWPLAFLPVGGDSIDPGAGTSIPAYFFLQNGWKVKPQEANHTLRVFNGILIGPSNTDPFVNTSGSFIVRINYSQPVQAITVATGGGGGGGGATAEEVAQAVWDSPKANHNTSGSFGAALNMIAKIVRLMGVK